MERKTDKLDKIIIALIYVYFLAGIVWHLIPETKKIVIPLTAYGLYFFSILFFIKEKNSFSLNSILWFLFIIVSTFFIEVVGVKTGKIFGDYTYGNVLGIKLLGVPIIIALNWGFVLLGFYSIVSKIKIDSHIIKSILISTLTLIFDYFLEPVAIKFNYWSWDSGYIPLQNYAAWFLIAWYFSSVGNSFEVKITTKLISHYILAQSIFFITLNIFL